MQSIHEIAAEHHRSSVLIDALDVHGSLKIMERFQIASKMPDILSNLKVAFVLNDEIRDPSLFGENVAVNRGAIIKVVKDIDTGLDWLRVESNSDSI